MPQPHRELAVRTALITAALLSLQPAGLALAQDKPKPGAAQVETVEDERARLNREQADFAARQLAENDANRRAYEEAVAEREATIVDQAAASAAAKAAYDAQVARAAAAHAAEMARWRADVAACEAGNYSRCSQPKR
ncbi:MAG: hypothetical protein ABIT10_11920 [Alteraurantiacibacter sp.]